ncbi:hypothetical protein BGW37DRAFT_121118 [Umbelopsis sp. PMI_123]|nr:hypothetical protein BGW37DRAFT_121118 [Umbelopsis sp. PMI_123]
MATTDQIKVGNTSSSSIESEPPKETGPLRGPDIVLRTFQPSDLPYAKHIFYSSYFGLVPQGVKAKLMSPLTWAIFIGFYAYLLAIVPVVLSGMNVPWWADIALRIFVTFSWFILWFAALFVYTDRKETVDCIEDAMCNDMKDIEQYYLGWNKEERVVEDDKDFESSKAGSGEKKVTFDKSSKSATEVIKSRKAENERTASQFWVLTINSIPSATVAIDQHHEIVYNSRGVLLPPWKQIGQFLCRRYHLGIPKFLESPATPEQKVLFPPHKKNEATLQRLAIQGQAWLPASISK